MPISPVDPPTSLSAQRLVTIQTQAAVPGVGTDDWVTGWNYPPHRYGGVNSVGARLKHNANIFNSCNVSPYQTLLPTIVIQWLTLGFKYPVNARTNIAVECVPNPMWGRIRPDLNNGLTQWVQLNYPTGGVEVGYIAPSGDTVGGPGANDIRNGGRVSRVPHNFISHPWAVVNPYVGTVNIDAPITALVSQNPADPSADSKMDCISNDWWVRIVPYDEAQPLNYDFTGNPVLCTAAADPYVGRPRQGLTNDGQCNAAIASCALVKLTTEWQQVGFVTLTDSPDLHTTQPYSGITSQAYLLNPPPGLTNSGPVTPVPAPIRPRPSVGNWRAKLTSALPTWTTAGAIGAIPTSLDSDDDNSGVDMLLQQSAATAAKRTFIFRAVDATDGFTAETGLSWGVGDLKISKNGAAEANHSGTVTEIAGGLYKYEAALAEVDTTGAFSFRTNKAGVRPTAFLHQVVAFDPANIAGLGLSNLDAAMSSRLAATSYEGADAILDKANGVETGLTLRQALRAMSAALYGKVSGARTGTETFRNAVADTQARLTVTSDSQGNRTSVVTSL